TPFVDGATVAEDVHGKADVVVVGSGAGGAVVARELAARGRDVVVVEEGGFFTGKDLTANPREMIDLLYRNRGLTGALGRPPSPRNERGCLGTGVCAIGCPQDAKQAMHVSYVPRAQAAGARLYTRCRVDRILLSGGPAIGVIGRFVDASERETARELRALARH